MMDALAAGFLCICLHTMKVALAMSTAGSKAVDSIRGQGKA